MILVDDSVYHVTGGCGTARRSQDGDTAGDGTTISMFDEHPASALSHYQAAGVVNQSHHVMDHGAFST